MTGTQGVPVVLEGQFREHSGLNRDWPPRPRQVILRSLFPFHSFYINYMAIVHLFVQLILQFPRGHAAQHPRGW